MASRFRQPIEDLAVAKSELDKMKQTTSFREFVVSWQNLLMRLERSWQSAARVLRPMRGAQQWFHPYAELRKTDSLLIFVRHARNAEIHASSSTITKSLQLEVKDKSGRGVHVKSVSTTFEDGMLSIDLGSDDILFDLQTRIIPSDPEVTRFKSRKDYYDPPKRHLKRRIKSMHPVHIAELALDFYSTFVTEADEKYGAI